MDNLSQLALKSQTVCGAIHFLLFLLSWPTTIGLLKDFLDKDRLTFNCIPKPSDVIKQLCYEDYISTLSPLMIPLNFAYITFGILGFFWIVFILYSVLALRRIKEEQNHQMKECRAKRFMWSFLFHVCIQLAVLGVMMVLFCRFQTLHLPAVYKCSQRNNTQIPTNEVRSMTCHDLHRRQKSKLNIGVITIMAISVVLCIFSIIHLFLTRKEFLRQLLGDPESSISLGVSEMANREPQLQQANVDSTDFAPSGRCLWDTKIRDVKGFQSVLKEMKVLLDPKAELSGDYRSLASTFGMDQNEIKYLGSQSSASPTEMLLDKYNPTLKQLFRHLQSDEVKRSDVVKVIEKWIEKKCACENCNSLR